jgi:hypothetical protein
MYKQNHLVNTPLRAEAAKRVDRSVKVGKRRVCVVPVQNLPVDDIPSKLQESIDVIVFGSEPGSESMEALQHTWKRNHRNSDNTETHEIPKTLINSRLHKLVNTKHVLLTLCALRASLFHTWTANSQSQ